jgi:hypothetical protein
MSVRSKSYTVTLPAATYSDDDVQKLADWGQDNCVRAMVKNSGDILTWVVIKEKIRARGEWLRHVRGVFSTLHLDAKPLLGERWLVLCLEKEALEMIDTACKAAQQDAPVEDVASAEARDVLLPSFRRRGARPRAPKTTIEVLRNG